MKKHIALAALCSATPLIAAEYSEGFLQQFNIPFKNKYVLCIGCTLGRDAAEQTAHITTLYPNKFVKNGIQIIPLKMNIANGLKKNGH